MNPHDGVVEIMKTKATPVPVYLLRIIAGLILLLAGIALAQQQSMPSAPSAEPVEEPVPVYSIELIVFEYVGSAAGTTEIFAPDPTDESAADSPLFEETPPTPDEGPTDSSASDVPAIDADPQPAATAPVPDYKNAVLDVVPTSGQAGLQLLDRSNFQLIGVYNMLARLDAYRPLLHTGWIQPTLEEEDTAPLKLRRIGDPPLRLDGTVSLYLSRFLHLVIDLSLETPAAQRPMAVQERVRNYGDERISGLSGMNPGMMAPSIFYRIQEDRIVKNNELRYFDHPKFGVLAKITRIEESSPRNTMVRPN